MTIHRFFIDEGSIRNGKVFIEDFEIVKQISFVLRLRIASQVIFLDNKGSEYIVSLTKFTKKSIEGEIISKNQNKNESDIKVNLYQSITKKLDTFELILQKTTELGVSKFIPVICHNSQKDFLPKKERLVRIIKEAAEQSERGILPQLENEINFEKAVEIALKDEKALNLFCYERGGINLNKILSVLSRNSAGQFSVLNVFIGPEGGFTDEELKLIKSCEKFTIISLGPRILRTETAAIAVCSKVLI